MGQIGKHSGEESPCEAGLLEPRGEGLNCIRLSGLARGITWGKAGERTGDCPKGVEEEEWLGQKEL